MKKGKVIKFQPPRSIVKKTPYKKPVVAKPKQIIKCHVCGELATHVILIQLREQSGPPIKEDVLRTVCEEHINTSFDHWVPAWAFKKLCFDLKEQANVTLNKQYCTIKVLPFKKK